MYHCSSAISTEKLCSLKTRKRKVNKVLSMNQNYEHANRRTKKKLLQFYLKNPATGFVWELIFSSSFQQQQVTTETFNKNK